MNKADLQRQMKLTGASALDTVKIRLGNQEFDIESVYGFGKTIIIKAEAINLPTAESPEPLD